MSRKIRLLVSCPNPKDATSFYRGIGPITHLQRSMPNLELHFTTEFNWATIALGDVLFMQRPYTAGHVEAIRMFKANRKPVWIDLDDDLFNVPASNPAHRIYSNDKTRANIATAIASANVVSVSTEFLKRQLQGGASREKGISLNQNIVVIPNGFHERLFEYRTPPPEKRNPLVMWRGSATHHADVSAFLPQLVELVNGAPKWTFMFQGDKPWFLFEKLKDNAIFADSLDPIEYFDMIHRVRPQAFLVPLADDVFNRSKSNIAWIEAVFAGGVAVTPDWEEWRVPGSITYRTPQEFLDISRQLVSGDVDVNKLNAVAWDYIQQNLTLGKVNGLRKKLLEELAG